MRENPAKDLNSAEYQLSEARLPSTISTVFPCSTATNQALTCFAILSNRNTLKPVPAARSTQKLCDTICAKSVWTRVHPWSLGQHRNSAHARGARPQGPAKYGGLGGLCCPKLMQTAAALHGAVNGVSFMQEHVSGFVKPRRRTAGRRGRRVPQQRRPQLSRPQKREYEQQGLSLWFRQLCLPRRHVLSLQRAARSQVSTAVSLEDARAAGSAIQPARSLDEESALSAAEADGASSTPGLA